MDINESKSNIKKHNFEELKHILFKNVIIKYKFLKTIIFFKIYKIILSKSDLINFIHKSN